MKTKYIIITPALNEEKYIRYTLESVVNQTLKPFMWIIVNDGSTDLTGQIVREYTKKYGWIKLINNVHNTNIREAGSKVVRAFYIGYNYYKIWDKEYDFIVKLDADLTLPQNYFEEIAKSFKNNARLGLCGGYCVNEINGILVKEKSPSYHIRGAFKAIRRECWIDIGGFKPILGWDGLDEMTALYKGWETKTLSLEVIHHRPTASAYNSFGLAKQHGMANYKNGGNFFLALVRALVRMFQKPYFIVGIGFFLGYFKAFMKRYEKNVNDEFAKFINCFHTQRLLKKIGLTYDKNCVNS